MHEHIHNTRDNVSPVIQTPRISSKILRYFQLSSLCLDIPMEHCRSCLIYCLVNLTLTLVNLPTSLLPHGKEWGRTDSFLTAFYSLKLKVCYANII